MNNEQNKPAELTEKELEGVVGGYDLVGLRDGNGLRHLHDDPPLINPVGEYKAIKGLVVKEALFR